MSPDAGDKRATIALTGDIMLGRGVDERLRDQAPEWAWADIADALRSADLTLVNLESPIAAGGEPWRETHRVFHFRAAPQAIDVLLAAGVDCVNLANNHALDFGREALVETLDRLEEAGIAHVGAGRNLPEAQRPVILERRGLRIGILGACDDPPEYAARPDSPGTHRIDVGEVGLVRLQERVADLRDRCDVLILTIHWGPNMRLEPTEPFRRFARSMIDAGVILYHGHSAHVFQGIEWRGHRLVLYDTGDFLDDYAVDPDLRNDWGLLYRAEVTPGRVERLHVHPVFLELARTRAARGAELDDIRRRLQDLCRPFGSRVVGDEPPWRIESEPPEPEAAPA
jgi:poly-gamma-glutamate synthesis protein (capsule biosynthesis protein)